MRRFATYCWGLVTTDEGPLTIDQQNGSGGLCPNNRERDLHLATIIAVQSIMHECGPCMNILLYACTALNDQTLWDILCCSDNIHICTYNLHHRHCGGGINIASNCVISPLGMPNGESLYDHYIRHIYIDHVDGYIASHIYVLCLYCGILPPRGVSGCKMWYDNYAWDMHIHHSDRSLVSEHIRCLVCKWYTVHNVGQAHTWQYLARAHSADLCVAPRRFAMEASINDKLKAEVRAAFNTAVAELGKQGTVGPHAPMQVKMDALEDGFESCSEEVVQWVYTQHGNLAAAMSSDDWNDDAFQRNLVGNKSAMYIMRTDGKYALTWWLVNVLDSKDGRGTLRDVLANSQESLPVKPLPSRERFNEALRKTFRGRWCVWWGKNSIFYFVQLHDRAEIPASWSARFQTETGHSHSSFGQTMQNVISSQQ